MRTKKILKRYNIFNYEFIAEFLQEQHKEGWKLVKILPFGIFCFEECETEDMVYCIDEDTFSVVDDKTPYLDAFADRGWEFIQMFRNCNFFRKRKDAFVEGEELPVNRLERNIICSVKIAKKRCFPTTYMTSGRMDDLGSVVWIGESVYDRKQSKFKKI